MSENNNLIHLPRGGVIIDTKEGPIQFGTPPETIKDTMVTERGVPKVFVLPKNFFHIESGISVAEIEFPIYYNFFLRNIKTTIICDENRAQDILIAMKEAAFGPDTIDLKPEYKAGTNQYFIPDLRSEISFFRRGLELSDLFEIIPIKKGKAQFGSVQIKVDKAYNCFKVYQDQSLLAEIPTQVQFKLKIDIGEKVTHRFIPPRMGVTCLGPSHGFDPKQNTSGFLLWLNTRGIVIDPPVGTTEWLYRSNVNPKYIDSVVLTHCHSDHDAGTFQKILAEEKVNIYTTKTVMNSFLKKYSALTRIPQNKLLGMFNFIPITIEEPIMIHQGVFDFFYTLHSIPTIGFNVNFRGTTFVYSSDHLNNPELVDQLYKDGVVTEARKDFLKNFPWEVDVIYHEAGIPPIHTPIDYLSTLPIEIQKKTTIYHIAEKDFPENTHLTLAKFGIEHTNVIDVPENPFDFACDVLNVLEKVEYFNSFSLRKISSLLAVLTKESFSKGETIIQKGAAGNKFYLIVSGKVTVGGLDINGAKTYGEYDTFGEVSLLLNEFRKASIIAETDVELLVIEKEDFLDLIKDTDLEQKLLNLSQSRNAESWETLNSSPLFKNTTSFQKTAFEAILKPYNAKKGEILIEEGKAFDAMFLIREGIVIQYDEESDQVKEFGQGELIGNIIQLQEDHPSKKTYKAEKKCKLYRIEKENMLEYVETYPNIYMSLIL